MTDDIKIIDLDKEEIDSEAKCVSLGNFDGVHRGHQKLMVKNVELSEKNDLTPAVLLFKENTKVTLDDTDEEYITSLEDKIEILSGMGIKTVCILEFSEEFRSLSPEEFIDKILIQRLRAKDLVVGMDYKFGKYAAGNVDTLKSFEDKYDFRTHVVDFEVDGDYKISSRTIRKLLKDGDIRKASEYLDRPYRIKGEVVHGYKRGRELNFPTANLKLDFNYVVPTDGVYLTLVEIEGEKFFALTNIGTNPTFENAERKIETYILNFNRDIYGKTIAIEFLEFFRGGYKFDSKDALIHKMEMDKDLAYKVIEEKYL